MRLDQGHHPWLGRVAPPAVRPGIAEGHASCLVPVNPVVPAAAGRGRDDRRRAWRRGPGGTPPPVAMVPSHTNVGTAG